jgi:thymidylate synthase (FAD)
MPKIQTYNDMTVELMQSTGYPETLVALALSITMNSQDDKDLPKFNKPFARFIVEAEHMSVLEHVVYTFLIQGMSRSLLAQITRQRTASPTSGSQHYQNYSDYACTIDPNTTVSDRLIYQASFDAAFHDYKSLMNNGVPREEARQVLPNAACVNYLWTIDARNLFYFLRQRLCNRNVLEMRILAHKVLSLVRDHFPELFDYAAPQCEHGECKQGHLRCEQRYWERP